MADLSTHRMFAPGSSFGIMSGDKPRYAGESAHLGHEGLKATLQQLGLQHDEVQGDYDGPERSVVVYNPTREQVFALGRAFGQESVVWGHNAHGGKQPHAELLYTNGPKAGTAHVPAPGMPPLVEHFASQPPQNYYTQVPGGPGYFRLNFDFDHTVPVPLSVGTRHPQALPPAAVPRPDLGKSEGADVLAEGVHAYPWHDGHTDAHLLVAAPGVVLHRTGGVAKNDGERTDRSLMFDPYRDLRGSFAKGAITDPSMGLQAARGSFAADPSVRKGDNIGGSRAAGDASVPSPRGSFAHMADTRGAHDDGQLGKDEPDANPQFAPAGKAPEYQDFARPFGTVLGRDHPQSHHHYRYEGRLGDIQRLVQDHGYQVVKAGGKYGRPDLATKNYNTGHLMVYDPDSAGFGGDSRYTEAWRAIHELAHALTYPDINAKYGKGRRMGKLGVHRTPTEARRAVEWEWLAGHKQRELSKQLGIDVSDQDFAREMNCLMHDAAHRAVTGKFSDPQQEGFQPHPHLQPLETALGLVNEHAHRLGLQDPDQKLGKAEQSLPSCAHPGCTKKPHVGYKGKAYCGDHARADIEADKRRRSAMRPVEGGGETTPPKEGHLKVVKADDDGAVTSLRKALEVVGRRQSTPPGATTEPETMADNQKFYTPEQAATLLVKALATRVEDFRAKLEDLQKREAVGAAGKKYTTCDAEHHGLKCGHTHGHEGAHSAHDPKVSGNRTWVDAKKAEDCPKCGRGKDYCACGEAGCGKCGGKHPTSDHAAHTLFDEPWPQVLHPSDKKAKKSEGAADGFRIAWANLRKSGAVGGGSENLSSNAGPGQALMMGEKEGCGKPTMDDGSPCRHGTLCEACIRRKHKRARMKPIEGGGETTPPKGGHLKVVKADQPSGAGAVAGPPSSMNLSEESSGVVGDNGSQGHKVDNLRQKQAVPVRTDDPRANNPVSAPALKVEHTGNAMGTGGAIRPLAPGGKSPSNRNPEPKPVLPSTTRKADVPMAKPPGGNPTAAGGTSVPTSKPGSPKVGAVGGGGMHAPGLGKGLADLHPVVQGALAGAAEGQLHAYAVHPNSGKALFAGGALGALHGALQTLRTPRAKPVQGPAMNKAGLEKGVPAAPSRDLKTALMHDRTQGPHNPAAAGLAAASAGAGAAPKMPTPGEHAQRAAGFSDFMPAGKFGAPPTSAAASPVSGVAKPAGAAMPKLGASPGLGGTPKAPSAGIGVTPKAGNNGMVGSQSGFGGAPKPAGGAAQHLPKLAAALKPKVPAGGAAPAMKANKS